MQLEPYYLINLIVAGAYLLLGPLVLYALLKAVTAEKAKALFSTLFVFGLVLIPAWDGIIGRLQLKKLCEDTNIKMQAAPQPQAGLGATSVALARELVEKHGYSWAEAQGGDNIVRVYVDSSKQIVQRVQKGKAGSALVFKTGTTERGFGIVEIRKEVIQNGKVLASFNTYFSKGSWLQILANGALGGNVACDIPEETKTAELLKKAVPFEMEKGTSNYKVPDLPQMGGIPSFSLASKYDMSGTLVSLARKMIITADPARFDDYLEELIVRLGGAYDLGSTETVQEDGGTQVIFKRHLKVLETYSGLEIDAKKLKEIPNAEAGYASLFENYRARFLFATRLASFATSEITTGANLSAIPTILDSMLQGDRATALLRLSELSRSLVGLGMGSGAQYTELYNYYMKKSKDMGAVMIPPLVEASPLEKN